MSYRQLIFDISIRGVKVRDMVNEDLVTVTQDMTLQEIVDEYFMKYRFSRFPVVTSVHSQKLVGVLSINDIKAFPKDQWQHTTAGQVVKSVSDKEIVDEDTDISDAFRQMTGNNLGHLVIMTGFRIKGILTRTDMMRYVQFYSDLH